MQCRRAASTYLNCNDNKTKFMHKISTNTAAENVKLFTRDTSPYYYCQIKKPDTGKWVQKSTKQTDRDEALLFAQEWYAEMRFLNDRGYSSTPTQFSNACDIYLQELDKEQALHERTGGDEGRSLKDLKSYRTIVEQFIKPYFGDKSVDVISNVDVQSFFEWRRTYWTEGPGKDVKLTEYERGGRIVRRPVRRVEASDGTITRVGLVLAGIFKVAVQHRLIDEIKVPNTSPSKKSHRKAAMGKMQPKPAFTIKQYQELLAYLPGWCLAASRDKHMRQYTDRRLLLWDLIELIANTGMRPGTESDNVLWKHVRFYKDKNGLDKEAQQSPFQLGEPRLSIMLPKGKTGTRATTGNIDAARALLRIKRRYSDFQIGLTTKPDYYEHLITGKTEGQPLGWVKPVEIDPELPVSALPDGQPVTEDSWRQTFEHLMRDMEMTHDAVGRHFTPYVLRHSYISWQLQAGSMTIHDIANQCGNSVGTIEKHYAKVDVTTTAHRQRRIQDI